MKNPSTVGLPMAPKMYIQILNPVSIRACFLTQHNRLYKRLAVLDCISGTGSVPMSGKKMPWKGRKRSEGKTPAGTWK